MNGYETEDLESLVELLEFDESDESDESDEMAERWRRRRPRTASGRGMYPPRPQGNYVTQAQLQTALARVGQQIRTNSAAIGTLTTRVNAVSTEQTKQSTALRKEIDERKKQADALRRDTRQKLELLTLLPLISKPTSVTLTQDVAGLRKDQKVLVDSGDSLTMLLPLLLIGGLGGSSGTGGSGADSSADGSNIALLAIALSGGFGRT
jgi:hypothetical protein